MHKAVYYSYTGEKYVWRLRKKGKMMTLRLGEKIRFLRKRDGKTQEDLAKALGITCQAVSRWESNAAYPDIELIPAIAHYFDISIDELFGYTSDRERKIDGIIAQADAYGIPGRSDDEDIDACLSLLREGLAEFPQNERLRIKLVEILSNAGWRRHKEWLYYDDEGYHQHDYERHIKNTYWIEAIKICENLISTSTDNTIVSEAITQLVLLYRNFGETEKAVACANRMPSLRYSREILLCRATDGKEQARYIGEALLDLTLNFSGQLVQGLINNRHYYETDMPIDKIKGLISLFYLICDDGNLGCYHSSVCSLYLYLSRIQWERGYCDDAFNSLDEALNHARAFDALADENEHLYTAPLVSHVRGHYTIPTKIASTLPKDWPMWCAPDCTKVKEEITADPRWAEWVKKTQE